MDTVDIIIIFFFYAFIGWVIESLYVSILNKNLINSGLLTGPIIPVYGFGASLFIVLDTYLAPFFYYPLRLLLYSILMVLLEFYAGVLLEEIFRLKLWDYSKRKFNIKGKVCLLYSLYWAGLVVVILTYLSPLHYGLLKSMSEDTKVVVSTILCFYILADLVSAIHMVNQFKQQLGHLKQIFQSLSANVSRKIVRERVELQMIGSKRLLWAFPNLREYFKLPDNHEKILHKIGEILFKKGENLNHNSE